MSTFNLRGKIIRKADKQPISGLYIEAWDKNPPAKEAKGSSITDPQGMFSILFDNSLLSELHKEGFPEIYFKVFSGQTLLSSTENEVVVNLRGKQPAVVIAVDYNPAAESESKAKKYLVKGIILKKDYSPAAGYEIQLFDKGLITDTLIAGATTSDKGDFEVSFQSDAFQQSGKQTPDIFLKITGDKKETVTTSVIYNASTVTEINFVIGGSDFPEESEFEKLGKKLEPFFRNNSKTEIRLGENNNPFFLLGEKTGEDEQKIKWFITAHQLSAETKISPEFYYALLRGGLANEPSLHLSEIFSGDIENITGILDKFKKKEEADSSILALSHETDATITSLINLSDRSVPGALDFAVRNNIIPAIFQSRRKQLDKDWDDLKTGYLAKQKNDFETMLSSTQMKSQHCKTAAALFEKHKGDIPAVLDEMEKNKSITSEELNQVKAVDKINGLLNDASASAELQSKLNIKHPDEVRKLAKLSEKEWKDILYSKGNKSGAADKKIRDVMSSLEQQFPTAAFAGRLERDNKNKFSAKTSILKFFENYPETELHKTNFDLLFHKKGKDIKKEMDNAGDVKTELKKIQRVFKLAPSYEKVKVLLDNNIHSAQSVYNLGERRFVEKVSNGIISAQDAKKIYRKAEQTYAAAIAILGDIKSMEHGAALKVLPDVTKTYNNLKHSTIKDFPDWETLFTATDICECEDCRSVYSPAAYLTDLLKFLNKRGSTTAMVSAKEILFKRRPDIGEIDLNCDNSLVPIPYIDLVCETLEDALSDPPVILAAGIEPLLVEGIIHANVVAEFISKNLPIANDAAVTMGVAPTEWFIRDKQYTYKIKKTGVQLAAKIIKQTHGTAAERKAIPEYINYTVYDNQMKTAVHPVSLPFDLSWEECRAYLDKIGINKALWMEVFKNKVTSLPGANETAGEYIGLSPIERNIITTPNVPAQNQFWGGLVDIDKVSVFLHKSELTYKQLRELLRTKFINPTSDSDIVHSDSSCDTEQKRISNLTTAKLDRINRFLRLWRKTGWQMWELDNAVMNVKIGNTILDDAFLIQLKDFDELRKSLKLKPEEALGYFGDLNNIDSKSLYSKLFRNKVILDPLPDVFKSELVTENPFTNPAPAERTVTGQLKSLAAVLKLKEEEAAQIQTISLTDDNLSLSNISVFYRIASLIRKQKLSAKEYYILFDILNTGALFDVFSSPAKTKEFLEIVKLVKASKFSVYDLAYLLLHRNEGPKILIPTDEKITAFITKGRVAFQKIKDDLESITGLPDEVGKIILGKLSSLDETAINQAVQVFNGGSSLSTASRNIFLDNSFGAMISTGTIKAKLNARDAAPANLKDQATNDAWDELNKLLKEFLQNDASRQAIVQLHTEQFKLAEDTSRAILANVQLQGTAVPIFDHWFNAGILAKDALGNYLNAISNATFPDLFRSYLLIDKIGLLQAKMPLQQSLVELLISNAADFGILKYNELPVAAPVINSNFEKWKEYVQLRQFSLLYPDNDNGTLATSLKLLLPAAAPEATFLESFSAYTGWDNAELTELRLQLGLAYPADYKKPSSCMYLDKCMNRLVTSTMMASQLPLIIKAVPLSADAIAVKNLIKSKYDNEQWLNTSSNIQASTLDSKGIREKKRDALISYFTHHTVNGLIFKDTYELYGHYLLDVEMGSCEVTTRILQANLSVQLFVQRCLMNIELEVIADETADDGWKQWPWMKLYRVWEANRKVFLYPENWIEPELRLDKSYFFRELENDLMQNEITQPNVENAYLSYLEKLDNVGRLDVSGYYYEEETYTLYVFARTYDDPHLYYWRKWVEDSYWTPWEKLDLEINATHVIPLVINRRLYLYWPDFREKSVETSSTNVPQVNQSSFPIDKPQKFWEIRLSVSEFRNKKWTPKKISTTFVTTHTLPTLVPKENFSFIPLDLLDIPGIDKYLIGCFENTSPDNSSDYKYHDASSHSYFELGGCHGTPELLTDNSVIGLVHKPIIPQFQKSELLFLESHESDDSSSDTLAYQQGNLFINHQDILKKTPGLFRAPVPSQLSFFDKILIWFYWSWIQVLEKTNIKYGREWPFPYPTGTLLPFFYEDKKRTFFVLQEIILYEKKRGKDNAGNNNIQFTELFYTDILRVIQEYFRTGVLPDLIKPYFENGKKPGIAFMLKFTNFYHPYVCFLIKQLYKHGLDGMMKREVQLLDKVKFPELKDFSFKDVYDPTWLVNPGLPKAGDPFPSYPKETIDFESAGSYSDYNWELFFHAPLMLAVRLSKNQRFEEAQHWFHYIFNPTDTSSHPSPQKFWNTKPFFERDHQQYIDERIDNILTMINGGDAKLIKQVEQWRRNAFQPHLIAKFRTVAYQKTVVMKYLDNLIDWADNLFRSDRREAIGEATQLYILAAEILGPKPVVIPKHVESPVLNFNQLEPKLDAFSNAMINVENFIPFFETDIDDIDIAAPLPALETFYYCIPKNEKLLDYWKRIGEQLFKIRHCMNIDGIERQLALFDPPIDPGLLVKAVASGLSIGQAIAGLSAPLPQYRFLTIVQKANEFCNEVKSLGGGLLAALEKKDAEAMSLLRSTQEIRMHEAIREIRKKQIEEAKVNVESLVKTKNLTEEKKKYYEGLSYMNPAEIIAFTLSTAATALDVAIAAGYALSGGLKLIPQIVGGGSGFGGSPHVVVDIGGEQFGDSAEDLVKTISSISQALDKGASLASTQGSYMRRQEEWDFQAILATKELVQIDKQIAGAEIRLAMAEKELENHELQIEQSKETKAFMENKFTNLELYNWMIGQISGVYFQSYQLAFDVAKKAERCYRFELGLEDSDFIQFGYWDSMKKGLLSGEKLCLDIHRMESSWYDQNKREFEITKHISLAQLDPLALLTLKQNGECFVNLPEEIFDLDYPGHYFRRIKSVAVSVPCIIGPYNNLNCTLTILKSRTRTSALSTVDYSIAPGDADDGFTYNYSTIQQMVTSSGQNDAGMFDVNLKDERYLTFEGHGAISEWKIEINKDFKNFDMDTISDVILHVRYTARQGGKVLANTVKTQLISNFDNIIKTAQNGIGFFKLVSMKSEFPTELHRLLHSAAAPHKVDMGFGANNVPYWLSGKTLEFDGAASAQWVYIKFKPGQNVNINTMQLNGQQVDFAPPASLGELKRGSSTQSGDLFGTWTIDTGAVALNPSKIDDILLLVKYIIV
ncbi:MAG: hypothetical protein JWO92_2328 [Chitinophagaceae bacterium]|nr:hypothetical protein [Chitinophagaceae bacterium]MDB5222121.1 hypothetical protein [Chitinophagaceae bacterium]